MSFFILLFIGIYLLSRVFDLESAIGSVFKIVGKLVPGNWLEWFNCHPKVTVTLVVILVLAGLGNMMGY